MCGIAGIAGKKNQNESRNQVAVMLNELKHRGPNDEGIEVFNNAVFGHRRLSIFDLSAAGHQPMLSSDENISIVFNGAIYNFLHLRRELEAEGFSFHSQTDTEVLINGYAAWGIDELVKKIEGMFAFGLWDRRRETLYLVRDRLGVKPLMYSVKNGEIAFASTVRALKNAGFGGDLSREGVGEFFEFGFLTDETAIYENIEKLPAATILEWRNGEIKRRKYWDVPEAKDEKISFEAAVEETEKLFLDAVEKRLQADVPVGALLSGGIDSSLVCWAIAKLGGDVTAFTVGVPGDEWDESNIAKKTAKQLGIKHQILEMAADEEPEIADLIKAYGEPFACASSLGLLKISREVSKSATVLLTGDGGDDVFLGYPEHLHFYLAEKLANKSPAVLLSALQKTVSFLPQNVSVFKRANSFLQYAAGGLGAITRVRDGLPVYRENDLLGERMAHFKLSHREISLTTGENLLTEFLKYDRQTRFIGEYLPKVDGATMFHALESRSPFLDTKLWDFAATLPFSLRLQNRELKAVLREIVRRRISPELAAGKKQGFGVPVQRWLVGKWKAQFVELMNNSILDSEGWIKSENVLKAIESAEKENWSPRQLWFIFVLESWFRYEHER